MREDLLELTKYICRVVIFSDLKHSCSVIPKYYQDQSTMNLPQNFQLLTAIKNGYIGRVQNLLDQGHSPNGGFDQSNPLYLAIQMDKLEIGSLLIDRGANVNTPIEQSKNLNALRVAVMRGNKDMVSKVLQHGADWKGADDDGATVLHLAMEFKKLPLNLENVYDKEERIVDVLKILLDLGADVDAKTSKGETPLFLAGKYRMRKVVELLMERGADLNARDCRGNSLIHWLVKDLNHIRRDRSEKEHFIDWLLSKGADANCTNSVGETPLLLATREMSRNAIEFLLNHVEDLSGFRDDRDRTILHVVLELSVRKPWQDKRLAHVNSQSDPENPEPKKVCQVEKIVDFLLEKGLSVDDVDDEGNTAFHVAVKNKKWFAVPKLLEKFTNVNARNKRGQTALHIMIDFCNPYQKGYFDAVKALVAKGADIEAQDNEGLNPVQLAAKNKHERILNLFMEKGADLKVRTARGETLLHLNVGNGDYRRGWSCRTGMVKMLIDEGHCDVNATTVDGKTPLLAALEVLNKDVLKTLLERGADVNAREERSGITPILAAAQYNREAIETLIAAGADVNAEDAMGKTAMHFVVEREVDCVRRLLRAGARCDVVDDYGYTPLYYALKLDNFEAMGLLLETGADLEAVDVGREWWRLKECRPIRRCLAKFVHAGVPIAEGFGLPSGYVQDEAIEAKFHHDCRNEVAKMKDVEVGDGKTLLDFLRLRVDRRIGWLGYEKLVGMMEWSSLEKSYPMYCVVVMGRYMVAVERRRLLANGRDALRRFVGFAMPDICVDNIFGRLSSCNLTMMVRGAGRRQMEERDERPAKRQRME